MYLDDYSNALPLLDSLKNHQPENFNLDYLIGVCHFNKAYNRSTAIPYLKVASENTSPEYKNQLKQLNAPERAFIFLAKAYLLDNQIDNCISTINTIKEKTGDANLIEQAEILLSNAKTAQELISKPIDIKIGDLGNSINSEFDEYTALINADESMLVFTSRRKGTGSEQNDEGKYYEDIYISYKQDGKWSAADNIGSQINTKRHDACVALSPDGTEMYIYRDDYGIGNLYVSNRDSLGWSKAKKLSNHVNSKYNETHAAISHDKQTLYFISDIKGGLGGKDIYISHKLPNGDWSLPSNLGDKYNTKFDEDGVYIHPDGQKLYFSSKGHNSMGGYDIFVCSMLEDGTWSRARKYWLSD